MPPPAHARVSRALASAALVSASLAACSLVRSLDDLGNGVRDPDASSQEEASTPDLEGGVDGGSDVTTDSTVPCPPGTDLQTSAAHCGACGHACLAGDVCERGACTFANHVGSADMDALAVRGGWVVYNVGRAVWSRRTTGGDRVLVARDDTAAIERITTDGTYAYWTTSGSAGAVLRCVLPDCAGKLPDVLASAQSYPSGIDVDPIGKKLYWTVMGSARRCAQQSATRPRPAGQIREYDLTGNSMRDVITPGADLDAITAPGYVVVKPPNVFWTNDVCNFTGGSSKRKVWRQLVTGGAPVQLEIGSNGSTYQDLVVDDASVFYGVEYVAIEQAPISPGSAPTRTWVGNATQVQNLAVDDTRLLWTDHDPSTNDGGVSTKSVRAEAKGAPNATPPTIVWSAPRTRDKDLRGIAVDGPNIYVVDQDESRIRALPR